MLIKKGPQESLFFFAGLFYVFTRTDPGRDIGNQGAQCPRRTRKGLGNIMAEKTRYHRDNILRDDPRVLVAW